MTTPRIRSLVSLAAALAVTVALGGCAGAPSRTALESPAPAGGRPLVVRFGNDARDYVHVYLVGEHREWLLGRVEPGARAVLRIPDAALAEDEGSMRLAVLSGARVRLEVARDARTIVTSALPAEALVSQRWTFSQVLANGHLTAAPLARAGAGGQ